MQTFRNVLYVSQGPDGDLDALKQALSVARNAGGSLTCLAVCPKLPRAMRDDEEQFAAGVREGLEKIVGEAQAAIALDAGAVPVTCDVVCGGAGAVVAVQRAIDDGTDLLVKSAEATEDRRGFAAFDMNLLRKCPCPVWLCRPIERHRGDIRVAVAVDPESQEDAGRALGLELLTRARSLADTCSGTLDVISCWDFAHEAHLRTSPWNRVSIERIDEQVAAAETEHRAALDALVSEAGIGGDVVVHHVKGEAARAIPRLVDELAVDILVMGTVARTGITGFVIGNTAENVLRALRCSLLAMKPPGFVSPVKGG